MNATEAFRADAVSVRYGTRTGTIEALHGVDMAIQRGEFVAVLGPSGCGKSTLLKVAAGLIAPTEGGAHIGGQALNHPGRDTGVAFQRPSLLPWKSVLQNVLMPAHTLRLPLAAARERAQALLHLVGLDGFADNYPKELSGGMQQRVGLARMLLPDPALLLMDEPFAALDAMTRDALTLELQRIWLEQRKSVMFITHSIQEAVFLADRVLVMSARPGRFIDSLRVDIPRPRSVDTLTSPVFVEACAYLRRHFQ